MDDLLEHSSRVTGDSMWSAASQSEQLLVAAFEILRRGSIREHPGHKRTSHCTLSKEKTECLEEDWRKVPWR